MGPNVELIYTSELEWLGGSPLHVSYPRLYRLDLNPHCLVSDRSTSAPRVPSLVQGPSFERDSRLFGPIINWSWSRPIRSSHESCELAELTSLLSHLNLSDEHDSWEFIIDPSRKFSVKAIRNHIALSTSFQPSQPTHWNKMLPSKVNILLWRVMNKRIPTRMNLDKRGIDLDTVRCPVCDDDLESEDHIFAKCCIAVDTWRDVLLWWHIPGITITSLDDVLSLADRVPLETKFYQYFDVVVRTTVWHLWSFRNKVSFSHKRPRKDLIFNDIKVSAFTWISSRNKKVSPSWLEWLCNPSDVMSLRVSKLKKHETLESTWKTITDSLHIPLSRHLNMSDTFENHNQHEPNLGYKPMKKLDLTVYDGPGVRSLRVSKPKKHETLESTWKTITDSLHIPLSRHLNMSDTFENHNQHEPNLGYKPMKKLDLTVYDGPGVRSLRVSKPKKHETLESTWKTITDGLHIPLNRHLKMSDIFENHNQHEPNLGYKAMKLDLTLRSYVLCKICIFSPLDIIFPRRSAIDLITTDERFYKKLVGNRETNWAPTPLAIANQSY
ncbi:RNA-directed DNA polymerase, eukaryota, Reverse transcriptase zinc-binding domain protein [Artemisia annua]|uniref:RNA-directed DNA polymerase, eukaryota, Reverse transcriptase zinc-binding domain protein n=1 Tax=Artemisia annua TaxID=35608 RepID=A0A2U1M451_ARTAN|nr:RNA-directed DNA polymerase, eukaryota, Reverse transcriptase zinc-binding domain protein [Artemisia annua]